MLLCSMLSGVLLVPLLSMPCYLLHATAPWPTPSDDTPPNSECKPSKCRSAGSSCSFGRFWWPYTWIPYHSHVIQPIATRPQRCPGVCLDPIVCSCTCSVGGSCGSIFTHCRGSSADCCCACVDGVVSVCCRDIRHGIVDEAWGVAFGCRW